MGSTYAEVLRIVGCEGTEMSRSELPNFPQFDTVMYRWQGKGTTVGGAVVMFQGGKLINKSQIGLAPQ